MPGRVWPIVFAIAPWSGEEVLTRGRLQGLPVFGWGWAPKELRTRSQLRAEGLRPGGAEPVALLLFRHHKPYRREEISPLYLIDRAKPVRPMTPAKHAALKAAMRVRRTCRAGCGEVKDYCVPTSTRECWDCFARNNNEEMGVAA